MKSMREMIIKDLYILWLWLQIYFIIVWHRSA
jgi:hypothetical protein